MESQAMSSLLFLVAFIAIMYFLLIRPQRKKEKEITAMRNRLMVGDEIITIGGIRGKIVKTREDSLVIQVGADKVKFEIMRWGISKVVESSTRPTSARKVRHLEEDDEEDEIVEVKKSLPKKMKKVPRTADTEIDDEDEDDK